MRVFFLLFLLFPAIELAVLIKVGGLIGVLPTLLLIVAGSALGVMVLRVAGLATAFSARAALSRGELPAQEMLQGLLLALGGGLLVLPGFISDVLGLLLLVPATRRALVNTMRKRAEAQSLRQRAFADEMPVQPVPGRPRPHQPDVIEGEFERRDTK